MSQSATYILFDDASRSNLLPLTFTRPVSEIRLGITTLREKWEQLFKQAFSWYTVDYLQVKYPSRFSDNNLYINGSLVANADLMHALKKLELQELLIKDGALLGYRSNGELEPDKAQQLLKKIEYSGSVLKINNTYDIFELNDKVLRYDFEQITKGRKSFPLSNTNRLLGVENIFVEEGARVECATINAIEGPVYIGKFAEIMEGSIVRGPLALGEHSTIKMGAKIYGATTLGPYCKVGGEVHNSVLFGYSSKAHDGYLGNAVLGEWCNLGADTNNSNLKNNYAKVKLWNYATENFANTGLQFCGLIMGDHSKCGINTMFNTGTVVGVSANIYGAGFPRNFVPSFSWGGAAGFMVYQLSKVFETAKIVMARRGIELTEVDKNIFKHIFNVTEKFRNF